MKKEGKGKRKKVECMEREKKNEARMEFMNAQRKKITKGCIDEMKKQNS